MLWFVTEWHLSPEEVRCFSSGNRIELRPFNGGHGNGLSMVGWKCQRKGANFREPVVFQKIKHCRQSVFNGLYLFGFARAMMACRTVVHCHFGPVTPILDKKGCGFHTRGADHLNPTDVDLNWRIVIYCCCDLKCTMKNGQGTDVSLREI